ncbi:MAG: CDP-glycerol glycerophosphotransferase family protein, partial [Bacilli bacterium]|nr:CDP-glycerol glycerophosphotransferase family protein [Bacilli bacterium]
LYECNPQKIRITGSPRTDIILAKRKIEYFERIKKDNPTAKLIVYTPTHRNFAQNDKVHLSNEEWSKLNEFLRANNYILFFKPHPLELYKYIESFGNYTNIVLIRYSMVEETSDFNEYMHYFDMLISDYSSISTDFILFNRPVIHYMYDMDTFEDAFFKLNALDKFIAGPIVKTLDDMVSKIKECFNQDNYTELRQRALVNAYKYIDTYNCERIFNTIIKILK